ncbi:ATP-binding protein [Streptomyces sp. CB03238]|uniref:ATP-binding protein n=1 Tax=Streptomyces sp. CB03238 TaxID=1907777 RepID=UPI000A12118D|nr:ATP-binding protein [Streptomyces sp. CB03238]ORT55678.1 ATP-binding protein [Streptomyces sp. CB03238]
MTTGPLRDGWSAVHPEVAEGLTARFDGDIGNVTDARLAAGLFLDTLAYCDPPTTPESHDDVLLVVTELAANTVQYAPGPFALRVRRTFDGVHVAVRDSNPVPPAPQPCRPGQGAGGLGWHIVHALAREVSVLPERGGKEIHAFLPW